jgi:hypothetical protein
VGHPDLHAPERIQQKTYPYSLASGYVMRAHGYSWLSLAWQVVRALGGAVYSLLKGKLPLAKSYLVRAAGLLRGYCFGPKEIARSSNSQTH